MRGSGYEPLLVDGCAARTPTVSSFR